MSRVGKRPIKIAKGVTVSVSGDSVLVEGPKGKLSQQVHPSMKVEVKGEEVMVVPRQAEEPLKNIDALHGLTRTLINNMILGVTNGYQKELEIQGVGFRAQVSGKKLVLQLGFSHPVEFPIPEGIVIEAPKPVQIIVKGIDKHKVGEVAAEIRGIFPPEPYKGKGIRYVGEYVRKKVGKAVS